MTRWTTWVTPDDGIPEHVEIQANSSIEEVEALVRSMYPRCTYLRPRAHDDCYDFSPSVPGGFDELAALTN